MTASVRALLVAGMIAGAAPVTAHAAEVAGDPAPASEFKFSIARTPDDLTLADDDKSFAEASFTDDRKAGDRAYSFYGAAGATWGGRSQPLGGGFLSATRSLFVQIEREASNTTGDSVNNLNFGGEVTGFVQTGGPVTHTHFYALAVRYLSDDSFRSSAWSATARFTPEIPLPGGIGEWKVSNQLRLHWSADVVADWTDVVDAGTKAELLTRPQFARIGYDISARLRLSLTDAPQGPKLAFAVEHDLREDLTSHQASARVFRSSLLYEAGNGLTAGLVYERGRNLDSLQPIEQFKLTFGLRH